MISGSGHEENGMLFAGSAASLAEADLWTGCCIQKGSTARGIKQHLLKPTMVIALRWEERDICCVCSRDKDLVEIRTKQPSFQTALESYNLPRFNWEMCISTQAHAAGKDAHFHATLTCILRAHESSLHTQGRPKHGNITENHSKSQPSPVSPACTHPHTF